MVAEWTTPSQGNRSRIYMVKITYYIDKGDSLVPFRSKTALTQQELLAENSTRPLTKFCYLSTSTWGAKRGNGMDAPFLNGIESAKVEAF
jgi:hypothetical protein